MMHIEKDLAWSCPRCRTNMIRGPSAILPAWHCPGCGFDWVSGDALAAFLPTVRAFEKLRASAASSSASPRALQCPQCLVESFHLVKAAGAELDICAKCVGIALDPGEVQAVKSLGYSKTERAADALSTVEALASVLTFFC